MYLYEGNEINDYFLVTGVTVEKSCKKAHFPVFADAETDPTSRIHNKSDVKRRNTPRPPRSVYHTK